MEEPKSGNVSSEKRTSILELNIYDPMPRSQPVYVIRERTELEEQIAIVRRFVVKFMRRSSEVYSTAAAHSSESVHRVLDVAEVLRMERGFLPRLAAVGLSGLAGLVFAGRGAGRLQRMFYLLTFTSAATVVSWPQQTKTSVISAYRFARELTSGSHRQTLEMAASVAMPEESAPVVKAVEESVLRQESTSKGAQSEVGSKDAPSQSGNKLSKEQEANSDYGQSNPADKDLYSTRA